MPIGDLLASITGEPSPTLPPTSTFVPKRKATSDFERPSGKIQRANSGPQQNSSSRPTDSSSRPSAVTSNMANMKLGSKPSAALSTSFKNGKPTPPPVLENPITAKTPKKGSFAEIMARAKKAQESLGPVGKIQHKKIEKVPSKREREDIRNQKVERIQKNLGPNGKFRSAGPTGNGRISEKDKGKARVELLPEKKVKKAAAATTGYTGTARPKLGGTKPPPKTSSSYSRGPDRYRDDRRPPSTRYNYVSEDEEDEEDDYASDASSDMEAAAFEVDDEEEEAARIARREDAEALAEENRLKREKLEKKRRLAALAKSKR